MKAILNKILLYQEIYDDVNSVSDDTQISPFLLQLKLTSTELLLEVVWSKDEEPEQCIVHTFRDNSSFRQLTQKLLQSKPGEKITVAKPGTECIDKFFERTKLEGFLESIFFRRMDQYSATVKAHVALMKNLPEINLEELTNHIKSLVKIEGNWLHTKFENLKGTNTR